MLTRAYVVRIARLGKTALYCYSVIKVVISCIPFVNWKEMVVEGCYKRERNLLCCPLLVPQMAGTGELPPETMNYKNRALFRRAEIIKSII